MIATGLLASGPVVDVLARDADGPEFGKASPLGLLIVLVLLVATVFLIRSMSKHLRKLPTEFDRDDPAADQAADEGTDSPGVPEPDGDTPAGRRPHTE